MSACCDSMESSSSLLHCVFQTSKDVLSDLRQALLPSFGLRQRMLHFLQASPEFLSSSALFAIFNLALIAAEPGILHDRRSHRAALARDDGETARMWVVLFT